MGLAGRQEKQRISDDPRNTKWANDSSRRGFKLLKAMGWSPDSQTLTPIAPDLNRSLHSVPVAKSDTLGIGATKHLTVSSIFSSFGSKTMRFVNAANHSDDDRSPAVFKKDGFDDLLARLNKVDNSADVSEEELDVKELKKKREQFGDDKKVKYKKRKRDESMVEVESTIDADQSVIKPTLLPIQSFNPRMASRARHLASKRMANTSSAEALAGILGVVQSTETASVWSQGSTTPSTLTVREVTPITSLPVSTITAISEPLNIDDTSATADEPSVKIKKSKSRSKDGEGKTFKKKKRRKGTTD